MIDIESCIMPDNRFAQLPVKSYFDEDVLKLERDLIFEVFPQYLGHEQWIPHVGDYLVLSHENNGRIMVHAENGINLLSNVCRHRQATILQGRGTASYITCPLHQWTYAPNGTLLGAPHFPENPCLNLENFATQKWNGIIYEAAPHNVASAMASLPSEIAEIVDFTRYVPDKSESYRVNYNWKTFLEFYLEDYHVAPFHPGLGNFVTCDNIQWKFGEWYSVQMVGIKDTLRRPGNSEIYRKWHRAVLDYYGSDLPNYGAIWLYIYPNVMIEWYPLVLVISTVFPNGAGHSVNNVEFFHPEEIILFDTDSITSARIAAEAYIETAIEDNLIGERMHEGRRALWERGGCEVGPYQSPLEDGMRHFHALYRSQIGQYL
ncbi:Rieske (2Fe-2S) protein [Burkholderia sp. BDU5]|nr:Rieske (2Fe-2S) protein [Burkholderia sp. BDU5]